MKSTSTAIGNMSGIPHNLRINPYPSSMFKFISYTVAVFVILIINVIVEIIMKAATYNVTVDKYNNTEVGTWMRPGYIVRFAILALVLFFANKMMKEIAEEKAKSAVTRILDRIPDGLRHSDSGADSLCENAMSAICSHYNDRNFFANELSPSMCNDVGTLFGLFAAVASFAMKFDESIVEKYITDVYEAIKDRCFGFGKETIEFNCRRFLEDNAKSAAVAEAGSAADAFVAIAKNFESAMIINSTSDLYQLLSEFLCSFTDTDECLPEISEDTNA